MTIETLPTARGARVRAYVPYALKLARAILARVADGESVAAICREPGMPSRNTVARWAKERRTLGAALAAARAAAGRRGIGSGPLRRFCVTAAEEIVGRLAAGETLTQICADPGLPSDLTVARWRRQNPDFDRAMRIAREAQAERMCDEALEIARAVTPQTAFADHVKLSHLRWLTTARAPELFGRVKPMEAPAPRKPDREVAIRHFEVEGRDDGMVRMVSFVADKAAGRVVMDYAGDWHVKPQRIEPAPSGGEPDPSDSEWV